MLILFQVVLIVHVLATALWFGGTLFGPRQLREALALERAEARRQIESLVWQARFFGLSLTLVVLTGVGLGLLSPGGFGALPVRFHIALTLTLALWGLRIFVSRPCAMRIAAIVDSDAPIEPAFALVKRMSMHSGISHLLFTVVLTLMLWRL